MNKRIEALKQWSNQLPGRRLCARLNKIELNHILLFIEKNATLNVVEFEIRINRMFLDLPEKPKNWAIIMEILSCVNSHSSQNDL